MRNILLSAVVGFAFFHVTACGGKPSSDPDTMGGASGSDPSMPISGGTIPDAGSAPSSEDSGVPSAQDSGVPVTHDAGVPGCPSTTMPTDDPCAISEGFAVFVSSSLGSAAGDGTRAKPFGSMQTAINAAKTANKWVYACAESYAETLTFADGVFVFGYFDCTSGKWTPSAARARITAPSSPAARATNIVTPTHIEGLEIVAPDATASSGSSIALIATGSTALYFFNSRLHAGAGKKGDDGVAGTTLVQSGTLNGAANTTVNECGNSEFACDAINLGGVGGTSICTGVAGHNGGNGGNGGFAGRWSNGPSGAMAIEAASYGAPQPGTATTSVGANFDNVHSGAPGGNGANGGNGASAVAIGVFSATGYAAADGTAGLDGAPGMGGGGGAGHAPLSFPNNNTDWYGVSGVGGGGGGCPGLAGTHGKGGGASIAILAIDSPVQFHTCTIESSGGGNAGLGSFGSRPTAGGAAGADVAGPAYGPNPLGGGGGNGGTAGASGHGAGGPSIGIASHGSAPSIDGAAPVVGAGGQGGAQLTSFGVTIAASPAGPSVATYAF